MYAYFENAVRHVFDTRWQHRNSHAESSLRISKNTSSGSSGIDTGVFVGARIVTVKVLVSVSADILRIEPIPKA
jgi:hypothetical protein